MVFEKVYTTRSAGECINSIDRALRALGIANNQRDDRRVLEMYDVLSSWAHNLGSALLNQFLVRVEAARKSFPARAREVGAENAFKEYENIAGYYEKLAEEFSKSEKTSKYASLDLQNSGKGAKRRIYKISKQVEKEKRSLISEEKGKETKNRRDEELRKRRDEMKRREQMIRQQKKQSKQKRAA